MKAKLSIKNTGLQALTESQTIFDELLKLNDIKTGGLLIGKSKTVILEVIDLVLKKMSELKGIEHDAFIEKFDYMLIGDLKNQIWEKNHIEITQAISQHSSAYNVMPSKSQIAQMTGLSRQTVYKHMNDYATHPAFIDQFNQFKFMGQRVLSRVLESALEGDIKASRLYFELIGENRQIDSRTCIKNQNNFIQINETVLSQEALKQLSPEQLNQIERILKPAIVTLSN